MAPRSSAIVVLLAGCAGAPAPPPEPRSPPVPAAIRWRAPIHVGRTPLDATSMHRVAALAGPFGMPEKRASFGSTRLVARAGYALEHSDFDRIPLWVAEHLAPRALGGVAGYRRPKWRANPELSPRARGEDADFAGSGWDRGHLAPSADFGSKPERDATFFLSNAVPQESALNRGLWAQLEARARRWAEQRGEAWVVSGGFFYDPEDDPEEGAGSGDGRVRYLTIGEGAVSVPTHLFKIVLAPRRTGGGFEAIAFVVENRAPEPGTDLAALIRSVDWIEARTGLDFFPRLAAEPAKEAEIEARRASLWE